MYSGGYKGAYSTGYACDMGKSSEKNTPAYHDPLVQQYAFILGENLRQLRKAQGLTQERLGLMIGTGILGSVTSNEAAWFRAFPT